MKSLNLLFPKVVHAVIISNNDVPAGSDWPKEKKVDNPNKKSKATL